jgi:hypothetical protein
MGDLPNGKNIGERERPIRSFNLVVERELLGWFDVVVDEEHPKFSWIGSNSASAGD